MIHFFFVLNAKWCRYGFKKCVTGKTQNKYLAKTNKSWWNIFFSLPCDTESGMPHTAVIVSFCGSAVMKSACMFMQSWACFLFLVIIIKQSKMPAVVVNKGGAVLRPVSACTEEAQWPGCQAAVAVGTSVCFGTDYDMWVTSAAKSLKSESEILPKMKVLHWDLILSFL